MILQETLDQQRFSIEWLIQGQLRGQPKAMALSVWVIL
jgi:hypothetical protein